MSSTRTVFNSLLNAASSAAHVVVNLFTKITPHPTCDLNKPFDPKNTDHIQHIENQIAVFNKKYGKMIARDLCSAGGILGIYALVKSLLYSGSLAEISLAIGLLIYFKAEPTRLESFKELKKQFDELYKLYVWCAENRSVKEVTADESFLSILRTIAPFEPNTDKLILWNKNTYKHFSAEFLRIMSESPHYFEEVKIPQQPSLRDNYFEKKLLGNLSETIVSPATKRFFYHIKEEGLRFFYHAKAEGKLALYHCEEEERRVKPS